VVNVTGKEPTPAGQVDTVTATEVSSQKSDSSLVTVVGNPVITSLFPSFLPVNSQGQTLTINGTGFAPGSTVTFNGIAHGVTNISSTQLTIQLTAGDLANAGGFPVVVTNPPAPGGGTVLESSPVQFNVNSFIGTWSGTAMSPPLPTTFTGPFNCSATVPTGQLSVMLNGANDPEGATVQMTLVINSIEGLPFSGPIRGFGGTCATQGYYSGTISVSTTGNTITASFLCDLYAYGCADVSFNAAVDGNTMDLWGTYSKNGDSLEESIVLTRQDSDAAASERRSAAQGAQSPPGRFPKAVKRAISPW
jgi:hypothetical protein